MATDDKAISNESTNNLIINVIKPIRNMKKAHIVPPYAIII